MLYILRFFLQNAVCFIILTYLVPVLFTFLYTGCAKIKKNNSGPKRLSGFIIDCNMSRGVVYRRQYNLMFILRKLYSSHFIQGVSEGILNILAGGSIDYSQYIIHINMCPIYCGCEDTAV